MSVFEWQINGLAGGYDDWQNVLPSGSGPAVFLITEPTVAVFRNSDGTLTGILGSALTYLNGVAQSGAVTQLVRYTTEGQVLETITTASAIEIARTVALSADADWARVLPVSFDAGTVLAQTATRYGLRNSDGSETVFLGQGFTYDGFALSDGEVASVERRHENGDLIESRAIGSAAPLDFAAFTALGDTEFLANLLAPHTLLLQSEDPDGVRSERGAVGGVFDLGDRRQSALR